MFFYFVQPLFRTEMYFPVSMFFLNSIAMQRHSMQCGTYIPHSTVHYSVVQQTKVHYSTLQCSTVN